MAKKFNKDYIDQFHDYNIYTPTRTIYMGSEESTIEGEESGTDAIMVNRIIKNLHILDTISSDPITIIMNNLGGDFIHGMAIYDSIKQCKSFVKIIVRGYAMSMGSIILQAADERIMAPNSKMMIHYGTHTLTGHLPTIYSHVEESKKMDRKMEDIYLSRINEKNPSFSRKKLQNLILNVDKFLDPEEAIEIGLADKIEGDGT